MLSHRKEVLLVAASGVLCAAGFGVPGGWVVVQLGLLGLFIRLVASGDDSWRAARLLALFVFCLYAVGQWGLGASVDPSVRLWAMSIGMLVAAANGLVAGATGLIAFRLPVPVALRVAVVIPALWTTREWLASVTDAAVPWLAIGYAQAPDGPLAAALPLGGVFLASGLSVAASAALAVAWRRAPGRPRYTALAGIAACVVAVAASGSVEWTRDAGRSQAQLIQSGVIPGNFDGAPAGRVLQFYSDTIGGSDAALIITPQLAIPKTPDALPEGYLAQLDAKLRAHNADALIGMYFDSDRPDAYFNGVQTLGASGLQQHRKHHLFPFGEYVPFGDTVSAWAHKAFPSLPAAARGTVADEPLVGGGLRLAVTVCYEIAFGHTLRARAGSADVIVSLGGDAVHDSLQLARQVRQVAQTRALEFQKPLLRASDVRGTYFIDAHGHVSGELPALTPGSVSQAVQGRTGLTPYARFGDMLALGVAGLALVACLLRARSTRRASRSASGLQLSSQRGQVLPVSLALLVIVAGFFYLMVNAGQTVTEKMRVTNAADAAAYSAGVVEARALNYDAYLNRGIVANEMAIAQLVSFTSWLDYFATAADNFGAYAYQMNLYLPLVPEVLVLDAAFGGSAVVAAYFGGQTVHGYVDYFKDYAAGPMLDVYNVAAFALAADQIAVQVNLTAGVRQQQIAKQVVQAVDPKLDAEVVLVTHGFDFFTKNYSGDDRARLADVAMRSRDDFTRERNFTIEGPHVFPLKNNALKKRGGTELIGLDEWRAVDTLELHGQIWGCTTKRNPLPHWCDDIKTPIGWGGIMASKDHSDAGSGYHGNAYNENGTTASNADSVMQEPGYTYFGGIPFNQEIADVDPANVQTTGVTILVTKAQTDTLTSNNAATLKTGGRLAVFNDHPAGGKIIGMSRAQVFFDRIAARADGKAELGSLYNPYWRVRLVAPLAADRVYAATKQGGLFVPPIP